MIFIPPIVVVNTINDFCIFFFRDRNHGADAPPHLHVVFPVAADADLVVTIITSQVESQRGYYRRTNAGALDALVAVDRDVLPVLTRQSIVDCNHSELMTRAELANRVDKSSPFEVKRCAIPAYLRKDICAAIRKSPLIPGRLKKLVKEFMKQLG